MPSLTLDTTLFDKTLTDLRSLFGQVPEAASDFVVSAIGLFQFPSEAFTIDCDNVPASGTGEIRACLKPSERLLDLMATLRALDSQPGKHVI